MLIRHCLSVAICCAALVVGATPASASHYINPERDHLAKLNGHAVPTAYLVDYTDTTWPVSAAAQEWDRSSRVDIFRVSSCPSGNDYCIPVQQINCVPGLYGQTIAYDNGNGHWSRTGFQVNYCDNNTPSSYKRKVACDEQGHVLGLGHRSETTSCLRQGLYLQSFPDGHDFDMLGTIYNH